MAPTVTGTSVIGLKYNNGVLLCADTLASYGSLAKLTNVTRFFKVNKYTIIGASGDISDFQYLQDLIEYIKSDDDFLNDGTEKSPRAVHSILTRILYNRRCKFDPCYNIIVVSGFYNNQSFLGYIDLIGNSYEDDTICSGFGAHLARPLLRKALEKHSNNLTEEQAREVLKNAARVLLYRDCRTLNKVELAVVNGAECKISEPFSLETDWSISQYVRGYE